LEVGAGIGPLLRMAQDAGKQDDRQD
jgi:hypothetical protein